MNYSDIVSALAKLESKIRINESIAREDLSRLRDTVVRLDERINMLQADGQARFDLIRRQMAEKLGD